MSNYDGKFSVNATPTLTIVVQDKTGPMDISDVTSIQYLVRKPDQSVLTGVATFTSTGVDGSTKYTFGVGELNKEGKYEVQVKLIAPTWRDQSTSYEFTVRDTIQ